MNKKFEEVEKFEELEVFPWNENFETGIQEVDEQHKTLVILLNKLANSLTQEKIAKVEDTFSQLAKYADYHFKSEEKIWEKYFDKRNLLFKSHKHSHDSFLPTVIELQEKNKDKPFYDTAEEILLFLIRWLAFHIIDEDKRLALIIDSINNGKELNEAKLISDSQMGGSMKILVEAILSMYDSLSIKAINLIRERKARILAQKELRKINKKLEKLSITDQLTGLHNRRHFEEIFEQELKRAKRNNTIISLILFDIDYFKKLNDTYGHIQGDKALKSVAKCMKRVCKRANDFAFRVGGEEFAIVITNEESKTAIELCEILKKEIEEAQILNENSSVSKYLTISAGVVSKIPNDLDDIDSFSKIADERLYEAKELGRNLIIF
jgi:diguanylate cyclase (GGDEF)-like protein/hemerythrin-like metal-binding protein